MNLPNNDHDHDGSSHNNPVLQREDQTYLTVDGEAWDVSNLLNSLPCDSDDDDYCLDNKKVTPSYGHEIKEEPRKLPASLKKVHNDNLTLKPVPKYDWRSEQRRTPSPELREQQQQQDNARYNNDQDEFYYEDERGGLQASAGGANSSLHQSDLQMMGHNNSNTGNDTFERSLIEVFPGVEMALRGSVETQAAITRNFIATASCMDCTLQLQCIRDAEYVLCPLCHCVSPMELSCSSVMQGAFGVGLGFCDEEL